MLAVMCALPVVAAVAAMTAEPAHAEEPSQQSLDDAAAQQLVDRFAPIMMVKQQEGDCDAQGEPYRPAAVETVLDNPDVALRQISFGAPVVTRAPSAADLFDRGEGFYLDFPGSALTPGCLYEQDFRRYNGAQRPVIYAHIVQQPDVPDKIFVQYWFYWYFNDWNDKHESDWEGITLAFDAATVEAALQTEPVAVGYSQHEGGERAGWTDDKLEREGDRPVVYSSVGSHASYFSSTIFLGRGATEGFGCDNTSGPSARVDPAVVLLPDEATDPSDPFAWLAFDGRWGEHQSGPFNGPTGPNAKAHWLEPAPWFDELRDSSVVIPAGDSVLVEVIDVFCNAAEWGAGALITLTVTPTRVVLSSILLIIGLTFLARRTDWSPTPASPIRRRRRAGQIVRTAGRCYAHQPKVFILAGLVYLPAAIVTGLLARLVQLIPLVGTFLSLAKNSGGTNLILAALVGSVANVAAFFVVNAVVADYLDHERVGVDGLVDAVRHIWSRRRDLLGAYVRTFAVVFVLLASFVGIPWGIRQLVRYQFVPQAVALDGQDARGALRSSSDAVRGRWFHTALLAALLNGLVLVIALGVALALLVLASGLPLWLFAGLAALVGALVVPFASIAMTLLYGDALAAADE